MWLYWFTDTIHNHFKRRDHIKNLLFSTCRDSKNYVLHNCIDCYFTQWSCGLFPIGNINRPPHVASDGWNIWDKNYMLHRAHTQIDSPRVACWPVCNFSFLEDIRPGSPYTNFKRVSVEGKILPALWFVQHQLFENYVCCSHILLCRRKKSCASWYAWNLVNL